MSVVHNLTGIPQETMQGQRLKVALGMGVPELTAIANSGRAVNGVDSMTAVMALNIIGPAKKAAMEKQAGQQQKAPSVKDQVVAQAAPEDTGIGALPAGEVMSEKGMASGGIVAFEEGGLAQDLTRQIAELRRRRQALDQQAGPVISARGGDTLQRQKDTLDMQIAQLENQFKATQGREQAYQLQRATETAPGIPFQAPAAAAAGAEQIQQPPQGQQPPGAGGGFGGGAPAGFPGVGASLNAAQAALKARGEFDPFASYSTFDPTQYSGLLPMTPDKLREQRAPAATELEGMFPKTREEAEAQIGKRYAGLEEMFKQREARAGEARKEAETEKGRTAGLGLMQLASELITKPLTKIDTGAAFQTFKDANTDFRKAQKEYRDDLDKIAEARELQKIGQYEKADQLFREGAMARFNFANETDKLAIAQDAVYKTGVRSVFDKKTEAQAAKLDAAVKSAELGLSAALKGAELGSEERRTAMTASAYGQRYTTPGYLQNLAQDNAAKRLEGLLKADPLLQTKLMKNSSLAMQLQNQLYNEELAKLQGTAAPSGGGADRVGQFKVERIN